MLNKNLSEILNADKKARERISSASELSARIQKKLDEDRVMLEKRYAEESEKEITESREKHERILEEAEKSYNERFEKVSSSLQVLYEKKKNAWISEIICGITEEEAK